jgi:hypothetical protein
MARRSALIVIAILGLPLLTGAAPAPTTRAARLGDPVRSATWQIVVRSLERRPIALGAAGATVAESEAGVLIVVDVTNLTSRPLTPRASDFALRSATGRVFPNRTDAMESRGFAFGESPRRFNTPIAPGATMTAHLVFAIALETGPLTLRFAPAWSQPVRLDECHCNLPSPTDPRPQW